MASDQKYRPQRGLLGEEDSPAQETGKRDAPPPRRASLLSEIGDTGRSSRPRPQDTPCGGRKHGGAEVSAPRECPPDAASAVLSVRPVEGGAWVEVVLRMTAEEAEQLLTPADQKTLTCKEKGGCAVVTLSMAVEQYGALRPKVGEVSVEQATALLEAGRLSYAIRRGMGLLACGSPSRKGLEQKLTARGVSRDTAHMAAAYLADQGFVRESDTAGLRVEQGLRKGWGPRRIREDLRAKGYDASAIEEAMEAVAELDHVERLAAVIRKKYTAIPTDRRERDKMVAALLRLGYDGETVREALWLCSKKER